MSEVVPEGWKLATIGALITESRIPLSHDDPSQRLAVRLHLNGVEKRSERATDGIGATKYFKRRSGQFVYGKQNLHKGALGLIPTIFDGYSSSQDIPCFDIDQNVNAVWFLQYFMQVSFYEGLERIASGTGSKRIQPSNLFEEEILTPPLPEQNKIAAILTSVDDVIETTQKQIDKLQDLKKATMNELLTKGIGHTEFKDSELGRIPKSWEVKTLSDVVNPKRPITYGIVQAGPHVEGGIPYIRVSDMNADNLHPKNMLRTSREIVAKFNRSTVTEGDIVYALRGNVGKVMRVPKVLSGANLTQGTALISQSNKIESDFLVCAMQSELVQKQTNDMAKGSTFVEMTLGNLKNIKLVLPPVSEQKNIANILSSFSRRNSNLCQKLTQTQSLKKSLMQDLLTGKVRVKVD